MLINPFNPTAPPTFVGANAANRLPGGFADVYLDFDQSGTDSAGDVQVEDDIFLISNHSHKLNPAQGQPRVLPPVGDGRDPGSDDHGVACPSGKGSRRRATAPC